MLRRRRTLSAKYRPAYGDARALGERELRRQKGLAAFREHEEVWIRELRAQLGRV